MNVAVSAFVALRASSFTVSTSWRVVFLARAPSSYCSSRCSMCGPFSATINSSPKIAPVGCPMKRLTTVFDNLFLKTRCPSLHLSATSLMRCLDWKHVRIRSWGLGGACLGQTFYIRAIEIGRGGGWLHLYANYPGREEAGFCNTMVWMSTTFSRASGAAAVTSGFWWTPSYSYQNSLRLHERPR